MEMQSDFLIIGAGIIGLTLAKNLRNKYPDKKIILIDKENDVGYHASGRNSGVLHAGFYYTKDTLKARFTREGNYYWRTYCNEKKLKINQCGKVIVAKDEGELEGLFELKSRGNYNNVELYLIDDKELKEIEPNAKTYKNAIWSPTTATVNPQEICEILKKELINNNIDIYFNTAYKKKLDENTIIAGKYIFQAGKIINAAGLYADKIAKDFGCANEFIIIPFKGLYLEYKGDNRPIRKHIYPVPCLQRPFLGTHYTIKVDGTIKLGPTAIPAFWRENYSLLENFSLQELFQILFWESKLFISNAFDFRDIAFEEIKKYHKKYLALQGKLLVKNIDVSKFSKWGRPGIRAQLLNTKTSELVMDFVIENDKSSLHILNAVSPAFTASYPFTKWIVEKCL